MLGLIRTSLSLWRAGIVCQTLKKRSWCSWEYFPLALAVEEKGILPARTKWVGTGACWVMFSEVVGMNGKDFRIAGNLLVEECVDPYSEPSLSHRYRSELSFPHSRCMLKLSGYWLFYGGFLTLHFHERLSEGMYFIWMQNKIFLQVYSRLFIFLQS